MFDKSQTNGQIAIISSKNSKLCSNIRKFSRNTVVDLSIKERAEIVAVQHPFRLNVAIAAYEFYGHIAIFKNSWKILWS